jgi:lipoprotein-anchoring transpeptidase ErfK/SrfK
MASFLPRLLTFGLTSLLLAGCSAEHKGEMIRVANDLNVYDTSTDDAAHFARQTYPVWNTTGPYKERDLFREERYTVDHKPITRPDPSYIPVRSSDDGNTQGMQLDDGVSAQDSLPTDDMTTQSIPAVDVSRYGKVVDAGHWLPPIPTRAVAPQFLRREVAYTTSERTGTIIVDTASRHLYLVLGHGRAMRYGVGIGRQGYAWKGRGVIQYQRDWPHWTPSEDYVAAKPGMKMFSASYGGLVGGIKNPLGARALYIYAHGKDTLYRVHGTPEWKSVGKQASSGCIRMFNQDVIDLAGRVRNGAAIIVE